MKKLTMVIALICAVSVASFAQKGLHAGLRIIPQSTWMFNSDDSDAGASFDYVSTWGLAIGPSIDYHFTDGVGVGVDIIFSRQGQKFETFGVEAKKDLKYLKLPILLNFNSDPEAVVYFQGSIGPSIGFLTSAKLLDADGDEVADIEDVHNNINFSIVFGFGVGFNVHENFKIHTGFRFDASPLNAEDEDNVPSSRATTRNINGGLELSFFYVLPTR